MGPTQRVCSRHTAGTQLGYIAGTQQPHNRYPSRARSKGIQSAQQVYAGAVYSSAQQVCSRHTEPGTGAGVRGRTAGTQRVCNGPHSRHTTDATGAQQGAQQAHSKAHSRRTAGIQRAHTGHTANCSGRTAVHSRCTTGTQRIMQKAHSRCVGAPQQAHSLKLYAGPHPHRSYTTGAQTFMSVWQAQQAHSRHTAGYAAGAQRVCSRRCEHSRCLHRGTQAHSRHTAGAQQAS